MTQVKKPKPLLLIMEEPLPGGRGNGEGEITDPEANYT